MQATILTKQGSINNLKTADVPAPRLDAKETLVKVRYCGLNHLDLLIAQGKRPGPATFPHILGSEIVGIVESVKGAHPHFSLGDLVAVYPWTFCGKCPSCKSGNMQICDQGGTIGRTRWGGYAQYVVVPTQNVIPIPKGLPADVVCASTLVATTAYHLVERAGVTDHSSVLVTGATGGVGTFVIQLLRKKHCRIFAATTSKHKATALRKLGTKPVILTKPLKDSMLQLLPQGVDYVIEIMGGSMWTEAVTVLGKHGTLVFCATTLDGFGSVHIGSAFSKEISIRGSYGGTIENLRQVIRLLKNKSISPLIHSVYSLSDAKKALSLLNNRKIFGKVLLQMPQQKVAP